MKTDKEIFNAIVRCTGIHTSTTCLECPYSAKELATVHFGEDVCTSALLRDALVLLSNRNTEIADLERKLREEGETILALNHQLLTVNKNVAKEFADKLKSRQIKPEFPWDSFYVTTEDIDEVLEELTGARTPNDENS